MDGGHETMIRVIGLGPGATDYILPVAIKKIQSCDIVIGGRRHLESIQTLTQATMDFSEGFDKIGQFLQENKEKTVGVVVSGDTGFHSMLAFVKRTVDDQWIEVIPGISALQYLFAKLGKSYEEAKWLSLHGRDRDISAWIKKRKPLGILLDKEKNVAYVANLLRAYQVETAIIYVGERLSYENELIKRLTVEEGLDYKGQALSVVVIDYE